MQSQKPTESPLRRIRVYSRRGCHLCEVLIEDLLPLIRSHLELEVLDGNAARLPRA